MTAIRKFMPFRINSLESVSDVDMDDFQWISSRYESKPHVAFMAMTFHATVPEINKKGMGITLATHNRSLMTALNTQVNFEHQAPDLALPNPVKDFNIVGHICELMTMNMPREESDWIVPGIVPVKPVITKGILALYTRVDDVQDIVKKIRDNSEQWYFSLEIGDNTTPPAIWWVGEGGAEHEFFDWDSAPAELQRAAISPKAETVNGRRVAYLMGGLDGYCQYIGGGITKTPAGYEQYQSGNNLLYIANWLEPPDETLDDSVLKYGVYDNLEDVPSNLKKMDGVALELSQINEITKTAEAIEKEESGKNGWAIAKANFKKTHVIKDGKWVKKESKNTSSDTSETGGSDMKTYTQEELDAAIKEAVDKALAGAKTTASEIVAQALANKEVLPKTAIDGMFTKEQVDAMVKDAVAKEKRTASVGALALASDIKDDVSAILLNTEKYPLTPEGDAEFNKALERWKKHASAPLDKHPDKKEESGAGDKSKEGEGDKKTASMNDGDKNGEGFNPGNGGTDANAGNTYKPKRVGME